MNIVVIFAHPDVDNGSLGNKIILDELGKVGDIQVREIYKMYPDYNIDIKAEQQALLDADLIVFQFPFYWYAVPALLKEWEDRVLEHGFAFGSTGDKLKGKQFMVSTTIGGPKESYHATGYNTFTVDEYMVPLKQIAIHSGMTFLAPVTSHGVVNIPGLESMRVNSEVVAKDHARRLIKKLRLKLSEDLIVMA